MENAFAASGFRILSALTISTTVIGSKRSVSSIVVALHQLGFAEIFEWTDFLSAPNADQPLQFQPGEVMKALVKFLPREE